MRKFKFEIEQTAEVVIEAETKEDAYEKVMHNIVYYFKNNVVECEVSKGEEVK